MVRRRIGASILVAMLALGGPAAAGASSRAAPALLPPSDPPVSIAKQPAFSGSCVFRVLDDSVGCRSATLQALDNARAQEGLGPLVLPTNYAALSHAQQVFTVLNIERVDRHLAPITGMVDALSNAALLGALGVTDPQLPGGYPFTRYGTIFAGGESTALGSVYDWMYFDGPGGNNGDCPAPGAPKCWIHRNVILGTYDNNPSSMGTGAAIGTYQGLPLPLYGGLIVGDSSGRAPGFSFTWAQEEPYLTPPPVVRSFEPTSGPASGGTTVTVTGANLKGVTQLVFGSGGATNLRPSADGSSLTATAPPGAPGATTVELRWPTGASKIASFTYNRSAPSAPRSLAATVPAANEARVTWAPPGSDGGLPLTGITVTPLLWGRVAQPSVAFGPAVTSTTFAKLVDGETYTFRVGAANDIGAGVAAVSPLVLPPFTSLTAFVQRQHQDLNGTAVPATELLTEVSSLDQGADPATYVAGLRRSTDATGIVDPTARLYFAYFLRIPDVGGLGYWIGRVRARTSLSQVSSSFAASRETATRYGQLSDQAFVQLVYQNVLGRAGDAGGVAFWSKQLATKVSTRGTVMLGFSESSEYKAKKGPAIDVAVTWIDLLGASPDPPSFDQWTAALTAGTRSVTDLAASLLADPRYTARVG